MPNGDAKSGQAAAPQNAQEKVEKPGIEQLNENYFKRVNEEFEKIVKERPEEMMNAALVDDIAKRNEKSFGAKVIDALKDPGEALKWGGNLLKTYAASWLGEISGLKKYVFGLKDKIQEKIGKAKGWGEQKKKGVEEKLDKLKEDVDPDAGYEMEDFEKALPNYYKDFKEILIPVKQFAVRNRLFLGVLGTVMMVKHFDRLKSAVEGSKDFLLGLAKMPWPKKLLFMGSLCGSMAILMHLYKTEELGKIKVPKDSRNFKKWLETKFQHEEKKIKEFLDAEGVPDLLSGFHLHIDILDQLAQGKKKIKDFIANPKEAVGHLLEGAKEWLRQHPDKFVRDQNIKGLESFLKDIDLIALRAPSDQATKCLSLQDSIRKIVNELKNGEPLRPDHVTMLKTEIEGLGMGFELIIHEGFLIVRKSGDPAFNLIKIGIDPSLTPDQQFEKAWEFWPEEGGFAGTQKSAENLLEQLRFALDTSMFAFEYKENAPNLLMRLVRGGFYLIGSFGKFSLTKGTQEYYLGPWELVWDLVRPLVGGKEFSAVEFAVDWEDMILPVFCFGVSKHIAVNVIRGKVKEGFLGIKPKNILVESAVYPLLWTGRRLIDGLQMGKALMNGQFSELLKNKALILHDAFFEFMARVKYRRSWFPGKLGKAIAQERWVEANLWEALSTLRAATNNPLRSEPDQALINQARAAVKAAGDAGEGIAFADKSMQQAKDAIPKIEQRIREREERIAALRRSGKPVPAVEADRQEAPEHASEAEKAGADKTKREQIEMEGKRLNAELERLQLELEQRRKYIVNTAMAQGKGIGDPEVVRQIAELEKNMGGKILAAEENLKTLYRSLHPELGPEAAPRAGHPSVPEAPTKAAPGKERKLPKPPSKIRRLGLHFLGLGASIGISAGLGIGLGKGIEALSEKEDEFSIEPVQKRRKEAREKPAAEDQGLRFFEDYAKGFNLEYSRMFDQLHYERLSQYEKEDSLPLIADQMAKEHAAIVEEMKAFLRVPANQDLLFRFYERLVGGSVIDTTKPKKLTEYFALSYDPSRREILFHYASPDDFKAQMYDYADFVMRHDGKTEATQGDLVKDAVKYATPGLGIYMDGRDMVNAARRGQVGRAIKSGLWTGVGAVADLAMLTGAGALVTGAVRGTSLAAKTGRAAKVAMAIGVGGGALDVAWQVFTPKHSQVMRIPKPPFRMPDGLKPMTASEAVPDGIAHPR